MLTFPCIPLPDSRHRQLARLLDRELSEAVVQYVTTVEKPSVQYRFPKPLGLELRDGLYVYDLEPIPFTGECPGGQYFYVDDPGMAVEILEYWIEQRCWAALDLETSPGWRVTPHPETGEPHTSYFDRQQKYKKPLGSDPWTSVIFLCSVSVRPGEAVVFDQRTLDRDPRFVATFQRFLKTCPLIVHGAMFEWPFLKVKYLADDPQGPNIQIDTLVLSQLAHAGRYPRHSLDACLQRVFDISLVKTWQSRFLSVHPESPLPINAIVYSAGDVASHLELARRLYTDLQEHGMEHIWTEIEQPFIPILGEARVHGMVLDVELLKEQLALATQQLDETLAQFNELCPGVSPASSPQLIEWFQQYGPKETRYNYQAKRELLQPVVSDSVDDDVITKILILQPEGLAASVARTLRQYRKVSKVAQSYLEPLLYRAYNPMTGRIHTDWKQCEAVTGRMAAQDPPSHQFPSKSEWKRIRKTLKAPPDYKVITSDYSQFEVRSLAEMSREPGMIRVFLKAQELQDQIDQYVANHQLDVGDLAEIRKSALEAQQKAVDSPERSQWEQLERDHPELTGLVTELNFNDFHTQTAASIAKVPPEQVTKDQRAGAKTVTFALPYGGDEHTISKNAEIPLPQAKEILDRYYQAFPQAKLFLEKTALQAINLGYTASLAGRKRFYTPVLAKDLVRKYYEMQRDEPELWEKEKAERYCQRPPRNTPQFVADKVAKSRREAIGRAAKNHPIQACNADVTKLASVLMHPRLKALDPRCTLVMWVHDEIVVVAPSELATKAAQIVRTAMLEASGRYLKHVPTEVSCAIADTWVK